MIQIHWIWLTTVPLMAIIVWAAIVPKEKVINLLASLYIIKRYTDIKGAKQYCAQLFNPISWALIVIIATYSGVAVGYDTLLLLVSDALRVGKRQKKPVKQGQ